MIKIDAVYANIQSYTNIFILLGLHAVDPPVDYIIFHI